MRFELMSKPDFVSWLGRDEVLEPTAVAMIIHGLNCKPARMIGIADMLIAQGVECLNVSLLGHRDSASARSESRTAERTRLEAFKSVTRQTWLDEVRAAYAIARERADELGIPLVFVGFSLGAALGTDLEGQPGSEVCFDGMILFAPALAIHWYTWALRILSPFPRLALRSQSPADYAANRFTPMAGYTALFDSIAELRRRNDRRPAAPALIFVDPKDELVSVRGLRALREARGADRWKLVAIPKALRSGRSDYHHLIIDEFSLGSELWGEVVAHVKQFLATLTRPGRDPSESSYAR
jgi:alpha-beta hydrolase superfamily lysophospholipase